VQVFHRERDEAHRSRETPDELRLRQSDHALERFDDACAAGARLRARGSDDFRRKRIGPESLQRSRMVHERAVLGAYSRSARRNRGLRMELRAAPNLRRARRLRVRHIGAGDATACRVIPDQCAQRTRSGTHVDVHALKMDSRLRGNDGSEAPGRGRQRYRHLMLPASSKIGM
jgi:hypothetical protein